MRITNIFRRRTTKDTCCQRNQLLVSLHNRTHFNTVQRMTIRLRDNNIMRNIHQLPRQVARVRRLQCRICQSFSRTVRRNKVLQYGQPFTEVRQNRTLNNLTRRFRHQPTHTCQLANLLPRTTRTRIHHHIDRIQLLTRSFVTRIIVLLQHIK